MGDGKRVDTVDRGETGRTPVTNDETLLLRLAQEIEAEELNGGVPRSEQWHRQLLLDMTLDLPSVRPAVVSRAFVDWLRGIR